MVNDIFSIVMSKKKNMILEYANVFFKYTVNHQKKITKTLVNIIDIYFEQYYLNSELDYNDLYNYFSLQNSKDKLLKETLASTIKFYQLNNIGNKIESDKGTIILISNAVYLAISLSNRCLKNYNGNIDIIVEQFLTKYSFKIRIKNTQMFQELKVALLNLVKRDSNNIKKAFKLFNNTNYCLKLKKIYDYDNHYLVELNYDIKALSKYQKKDIEKAIEKNIFSDLSLITLEQTILKITYDYLDDCFDNVYLVKMPIEVFEKQKYNKFIDEFFSMPIIKKNIVFLFEYNTLSAEKHILKLKNSDFNLGIYQISSLRASDECFDNVDYALVPSNFLEMYDGYQDIWKAKGIKFIVS